MHRAARAAPMTRRVLRARSRHGVTMSARETTGRERIARAKIGRGVTRRVRVSRVADLALIAGRRGTVPRSGRRVPTDRLSPAARIREVRARNAARGHHARTGHRAVEARDAPGRPRVGALAAADAIARVPAASAHGHHARIVGRAERVGLPVLIGGRHVTAHRSGSPAATALKGATGMWAARAKSGGRGRPEATIDRAAMRGRREARAATGRGRREKIGSAIAVRDRLPVIVAAVASRLAIATVSALVAIDPAAIGHRSGRSSDRAVVAAGDHRSRVGSGQVGVVASGLVAETGRDLAVSIAGIVGRPAGSARSGHAVAAMTASPVGAVASALAAETARDQAASIAGTVGRPAGSARSGHAVAAMTASLVGAVASAPAAEIGRAAKASAPEAAGRPQARASRGVRIVTVARAQAHVGRSSRRALTGRVESGTTSRDDSRRAVPPEGCSASG